MMLQMASELEFEIEVLLYLEEDVYNYLESQGVPGNLWEFYMSFARRIWERRVHFNDVTFLLEKQSAVYEFTQRGLDPTHLTFIQGEAEKWAMVKLGLHDPYFKDGFDDGTFNAWDEHFHIVIDSDVVHHGPYYARGRIDSANPSSFARKRLNGPEGYGYSLLFHGCAAQCYAYNSPLHFIVAVPYGVGGYSSTFAASNIGSLGMIQQNTGYYWKLRWRQDGAIQAEITSIECDLATWYWLVMGIFMDGSAGWIKWWVNGVKIAEKVGINNLKDSIDTMWEGRFGCNRVGEPLPPGYKVTRGRVDCCVLDAIYPMDPYA